MTSRIFIFSFLLLLAANVLGQSYPVLEIKITGNKKTKDFVILKELVFKKGDVFDIQKSNDLEKRLETSTNRVLNLNLFNQVKIIPQLSKTVDSNGYVIHIAVIEKRFIWPLPLIEFSDRNFNVWSDLDFNPARTNYGLFVDQYNVFGRNHTMKTRIKTGYNNQVGVEYRIPFLGPKSPWGLMAQIDYNSQNEVWYQTRNDSLQFFKNGENDLVSSTTAKLEFSKRIDPFVSVFVNINHEYGELYNAVPRAEYFTNSSKNQHLTGIKLRTNHDTRDNIFFPLTGLFLSPQVSLQRYHNIQTDFNLSFDLKVQRFFKIRPKLYSAFSISSQINTLRSRGYHDRKQLGYDKTVRGFEHYVVEGYFGTKATAALRYQIIDKPNIRLNFVPFENYKNLPLRVYLESFVDGGYASDIQTDKSNELPNQIIYSGGAGLNFLFYNDKIFRIEYSLNSLKDGGLFVHFQKAI